MDSEGEVLSDIGHKDISAEFTQGFLAGGKTTKNKMAGTSTLEQHGWSFHPKVSMLLTRVRLWTTRDLTQLRPCSDNAKRVH